MGASKRRVFELGLGLGLGAGCSWARWAGGPPKVMRPQVLLPLPDKHTLHPVRQYAHPTLQEFPTANSPSAVPTRRPQNESVVGFSSIVIRKLESKAETEIEFALDF